MTCKPFRQSVFLHAHGQLGPVQSRLIERHLSGCPACREEWQSASREASELQSLLGPGVGTPQSLHLTPSQLVAARSERLVNRGRAAGVGVGSWLPAGWAQHLGGRFEVGSGRGAGSWLALLVAVALLAGGLAAAAAFGPSSHLVQRCLGWSSGGGSCGTSSLSNAPPNGPGYLTAPPSVIPTSAPAGSPEKIPSGRLTAPPCAPGTASRP